jgi:hypothetical protein
MTDYSCLADAAKKTLTLLDSKLGDVKVTKTSTGEAISAKAGDKEVFLTSDAGGKISRALEFTAPGSIPVVSEVANGKTTYSEGPRGVDTSPIANAAKQFDTLKKPCPGMKP